MSKTRITENELKKIIRESVEKVINEDSNWQWQPATPTVRPPEEYPDQVAARNAAANTANSGALSAWKKLGTVGQIKEIQKLAGIPANQCDGRIGPQTLAKVYIALAKGKSGMSVDANALNNSSFRPGRAGTYTPYK